jgi:hypothetical protein
MQEARTYRQYVMDCHRIAATMSAADKKTLLQIAEAWEKQAEEAEKKEKSRQRQRKAIVISSSPASTPAAPSRR